MLCVSRAPFTTIAEQVALNGEVRTCIYEVPGANLGRDTGYPFVTFPNFPREDRDRTTADPRHILPAPCSILASC